VRYERGWPFFWTYGELLSISKRLLNVVFNPIQ